MKRSKKKGPKMEVLKPEYLVVPPNPIEGFRAELMRGDRLTEAEYKAMFVKEDPA